MSTVESGDWLTVSQAAARSGMSERAIRRAVALPENAAQTRQETRRTKTGTRQATVIAPDLVEKLAAEHRQNAAPTLAIDGANTGESLAEGGDTPAQDGATVAASPEEHRQDTDEVFRNGGDTPAEGGTNAAEHGATLQDVQIARIEGYLAANMASAVESAVRAATAPLLEEMRAMREAHTAQLQTMNETNAGLLQEIKETRNQVEAMRADKAADRAQLAKLEEMLSMLSMEKPEALSTVETAQSVGQVGTENAIATNAPESPKTVDTSKVSGTGGIAQRAKAGAKPRGIWARILKPFTEG